MTFTDWRPLTAQMDLCEAFYPLSSIFRNRLVLDIQYCGFHMMMQGTSMKIMILETLIYLSCNSNRRFLLSKQARLNTPEILHHLMVQWIGNGGRKCRDWGLRYLGI
jgi:hypothetical protein